MEPNIEQLLSSSFSEIARETGLGEPTVTAADRTFSPDTVVNIGITGDWHGFFFLQAKAGDLNSLMKTMVEHLGYASGIEDPTLFTEAFQELANQTSGRLMMHFANAGINGNITPPTVLQGKNLSLDLTGYPIRSHLHFSFSSGDLVILAGLKK